MAKDPKSEMRAAVHSVLQILADRGEIPEWIKLDGLRLDLSHYHIDLANVGPALLIPRAEGDRILLGNDESRLTDIVLKHIRTAEAGARKKTA